MRMFFALALLTFFNQNQASAGSHSPAPQTLIVECPAEIYLREGQAFDTSITGAPKILSNTGGAITMSWLEFFSPGNCSNQHDIVTRIFTIRNVLGDLERCTQRIYFKHLTPADIRVPADTTVSYPKDVSFSAVVLNENLPFRMITFTYSDAKLSAGCNPPIRIRRNWTFTNLCTGEITQKTSLITIQNYQNSFEHNKIVEDAICTNEGYIELVPKGEFGPFKYRWNTNDSTAILRNLSPGIYSAIVTDRFNCNQLQTVGLQSMSDRADVGGRIVTQNDYRVYPDSIYFGDEKNIQKVCLSPNGGLHYGMTVNQKKPGFMEFRLVKRTEPIEGISTRDIILIQRHILGVQKFVDTLKNFAADVNNNKNVTASDIAELRRLILGVKDNFTEVLPWYFLVQNWRQVMTPFQAFQSIQFNGVQIVNFPRQNVDVLAMKMGDIDLSYRRQLQDEDVQIRSGVRDVILQIPDQIIEKDLWTDVPVFLQKRIPIQGIQFSLASCHHAIEIAEVRPVQITSDCIHRNDEGIQVSASEAGQMNLNPDLPLFILRLRSNQTGIRTNQMICPGNRISSFYYDSETNEIPLGIQFDQISSKSDPQFKLSPNPAGQECLIESLSKDKGFITIQSLEGKLMFEDDITGSIKISLSHYPRGVYVVRLSQENQTTSQILIIP